MGMRPVRVILCGLIQAATIYVDGEGRFIPAQNISIVAQQAAINTVLGAGMTLVILTGGIDLSVGSVLAASAVSAVLVSQVYRSPVPQRPPALRRLVTPTPRSL